MHKIHRGDDVIVIAGKDKGRRGTVLKVLDGKRVVVESINIAKKHQKPNPQLGVAGGIVEKEAPIHISNLSLMTAGGDATRVGYRMEDGKKVRFSKKSNEVI